MEEDTSVPVNAVETPAAEPVAPAATPAEEAPKPRRRRTRKAKPEADAEAGQTSLDLGAVAAPSEAEPAASAATSAAPAASPAEEAPKPRRRGRRRKAEIEAERAAQEAAAQAADQPAGQPSGEKDAAPAAAPTPEAPAPAAAAEASAATATKAAAPQAAAPTAPQAEGQDAAGAAQAPEAAAAAEGNEASQATGEGQRQGESRRRRRRHNQRDDVEANDDHNDRRNRDRRDQGNANGNGNQNGQDNRPGRNRRHKNQQSRSAGPSITREELEELKVAELRAKADELGVEHTGMRKQDLVEAVYVAAAEAEGFHRVEGVLQMQPEGYAVLRTGGFCAGDEDAFVHQQIIRSYGLRPGDRIKGTVGPAHSGNKFPPLQRIDVINGRAPEEAKNRPRFRDLTPIYPNERLVMEHGKDSITGRAIDLVAPIGKGQRGLIVSPPKAGKTTVLKKICQSIAANNPEVHLFCLLVDERPEEVTDMERSIRGDVVASTFDMPASNHTAVAEMVIEHAKRLVEMGDDVVVVLDSITRLARAYNLAQPASGRILSGGVDSAALYPPKKFLGAARNIEGGGSLTILASALVDTGSKMDEVIFEEFKGTGNMELKLDRDLADRRIFPAIDPVASGTRNEDLLIDAQLQPFVWGIRRILANMNNTERAATALVKGLKATATNEEFLIRSAKKAAQTEFVA